MVHNNLEYDLPDMRTLEIPMYFDKYFLSFRIFPAD